MTASASAHPNRAGRKRRFGPLGWTLVIVAALIAAFVFATQVYTDWLWFSQLGFGGVFVTETLLKAGVFVVTALLVAVPLWASMSYAVKHAEEPAPAAESPQKPSSRVRVLRRKPLRNPSLLGGSCRRRLRSCCGTCSGSTRLRTAWSSTAGAWSVSVRPCCWRCLLCWGCWWRPRSSPSGILLRFSLTTKSSG